MPRSSRHKSHSKEDKARSDSPEKRKLGLDDECRGSKRRKESLRSDSEDKKISKASRKQESVGLVVESEEAKRRRSSSGKVESSGKEVYQYKEVKDGGLGVEKSSKGRDGQREISGDGNLDTENVDGEVSRKRSSHVDERATKEEVGNAELKQQDPRNLELDKELEKPARRKKDLLDKDKYPEAIRDSNGRRLLAKDEKHKDDRSKDKYQEDIGNDHTDRDRSKDKSREDAGRDHRVHDISKDKYQEDIGRDHRVHDKSKDKYQEDIGSDHNVRDRSKDKYLEDVGRDHRNRDRSKDKYCEDVGRDHRDHDRSKDKYREDVGRDHRDRDRSKDKYCENVGRDHKVRDRSKDKYREDVGRDHRVRDRSKDKYQEDIGRDHRDLDRSKEKYREDTGRNHKIHDGSKGKYQEDIDRDRMGRDKQYSKDHTNDRSYRKHSRDVNKSAVENSPKKSKMQNSGRDGSRCSDDRTTRHKDNCQGNKKLSYSGDHSDCKPRNTKEHHYEMEKKVSSGKGESPSDRGRSHSSVVDGDWAVSGSRKLSSPNTAVHFSIDNVRQDSKQVDLKYRDSVSEDRDCINVTSSQEISNVPGVPERTSESQLTDKPNAVETPINKDRSHLAELPSEKSPVLDVQVSPLQLKDKIHSSTSIEDRPSNRTPVRHSIDDDETGHRNCGSKDVRDDSVYKDKGSKDWPIEKPVAYKAFQADDDTISVSSSVNRTDHLPVSSSSVHPPPPFRTSVDSSSGLFVEDHRGKSSNPYKKFNEPIMGRGSGNAWKGVPNWSTETNDFVPFQQGPPPGFHPMPQKFRGPPIFGSRLATELNPPGGTYHNPDSDRYYGHGPSFRGHNRADDTGSPHLHGRNGGFMDESNVHEKSDWDQTKHMMTDQVWEAGTEMWKGQNNDLTMDLPSVPWKEDSQLHATMDLPSVPWKEDSQLHATMDEGGARKPGQRSRYGRSRSVSCSESIEIKLLDDIAVEQVAVKALKQVALEKSSEPSKTLNKHNFCHVYLSKLDISVDLAHPDLYKQCISLLNTERISTNGDDTKDLSTEGSGKVEGKITHTSFFTPHFPKIKDSILKRAMALYQQRGEKRSTEVPISFFIQAGEHTRTTNEVEKFHPNPTIINQMEEAGPFLKGDELIPTSAEVNVEEPAPVISNVENEVDVSNLVKVDDSIPTSCQETAEEPFLYSYQAKLANSVSNFCDEVLEPVQILGSEQPGEIVPTIHHVEKVGADETIANVENLESSKNHPRHSMQPVINTSTNMEDHAMAKDSKSCCSANNPEGKKVFGNDLAGGSLGLTDNPKVYEASAPMLIECNSVDSGRIHSPKSTH